MFAFFFFFLFLLPYPLTLLMLLALLSQSLRPSLRAATMWPSQSTFRPPCPARPPASPNPPSAGRRMVEPSTQTRTRICIGDPVFLSSLVSHQGWNSDHGWRFAVFWAEMIYWQRWLYLLYWFNYFTQVEKLQVLKCTFLLQLMK